MKQRALHGLVIALFGTLSYACSGTVGADCAPNSRTRCANGVAYWLDSCGKQGSKVADCACGCNRDFSACEEPCTCTPDCGSRRCGLDPVCGTLSCGTCSGTAPACNPATGVCQAALACPTVTGSRDAIIKQNNPDDSFGHVDYVEVGCIIAGAYRSLSKFDIDSPAGTIVQSASLDLYWDYSSSSRSTATQLEIYRVEQSWDEDSLSWNRRDANNVWDNPGGDWRDKNDVAQGTTPYASISLPIGDATNRFHSLEITQLVQEWVDGTHPNNGLLLKASNTGETTEGNHVAFVGLEKAGSTNRPRMIITTATCANDLVATPVFSPPGGTYSSAQDVAISTSTAGAGIRYTLDGSEPTESSASYSIAMTVSSTTTIKARAFKSGMTPSAVATATYKIETVSTGYVKIWDTQVSEDQKFYDFEGSNAWAKKAIWKQVPYGTIDYSFVGDAILDHDNFLLFIHSTGKDAPFLYKQVNGDYDLGFGGGEIYGGTVYGTNGEKCDSYQKISVKVVTNTADEAILEVDACGFAGSGMIPGKNVVRYRAKRGSAWLEKTPTNDYRYSSALHCSPNRFVVALANDGNGNDFIVDPRKDVPICVSGSPGFWFEPPADKNQLLLYHMAGSSSFVTILYSGDSSYARPSIGASYEPQTWTKPDPCLPYPRLGQVKTYVKKGANDAVYYAPPTNTNTFYNAGGQNGINTPISAGDTYRVSWKPAVPGRYRMTGRVNVGGVLKEKTITCPATTLCPTVSPLTIRVVEGGTPNFKTTNVDDESFVFSSPVSGILEDIVIYLCDRTSSTPSAVQTPLDIYRQIR